MIFACTRANAATKPIDPWLTPQQAEERAKKDTEIRWYSLRESSYLTANGEKFWDGGFTFASRTLPFGTYVRVTYHGRTACFRCNDRGPNRVELTLGGFSFFEGPEIGVLRGAKIEILAD